jgi:hypothetical protein
MPLWVRSINQLRKIADEIGKAMGAGVDNPASK